LNGFLQIVRILVLGPFNARLRQTIPDMVDGHGLLPGLHTSKYPNIYASRLPTGHNVIELLLDTSFRDVFPSLDVDLFVPGLRPKPPFSSAHFAFRGYCSSICPFTAAIFSASNDFFLFTPGLLVFPFNCIPVCLGGPFKPVRASRLVSSFFYPPPAAVRSGFHCSPHLLLIPLPHFELNATTVVSLPIAIHATFPCPVRPPVFPTIVMFPHLIVFTLFHDYQ